MAASGPHYYVVSIGERTNAFFEAFRDTLIDIQNGGFPFESQTSVRDLKDSKDGGERLRKVLKTVDERFCKFFDEEPLKLVVAGEPAAVSAFLSLTLHPEAVTACVEGDFGATSPRDLGKIVWPLVKEEISGVRARALCDLEAAEKKGRIAVGIDSVSRWVSAGVGAMLLVEDDYHMRGSINRAGAAVTVSQDVDVMEVLDDVVDVVISRVLEVGGNVVFFPRGSLVRLRRIVLLLEK